MLDRTNRKLNPMRPTIFMSLCTWVCSCPDCSLSSHSTSAGGQILIVKQHQHHFVGLYNQCCQHLDAAVCWALFLQIRSVISSVHETADGHSVGKHQLVSRLLKQYLIQCLLLDLPINSQPGWSLVSSTRQLGYTLHFNVFLTAFELVSHCGFWLGKWQLFWALLRVSSTIGLTHGISKLC